MRYKQLFISLIILLFPHLLSAQLRVSPQASTLLLSVVQQLSTPIANLPELAFHAKSAEINLSRLMTVEHEVMTRQAPPSLAELKYTPHLAFFCRVEVKIDKAIGTPFRFRLGSVDYVDYLEGKRKDY